MPYRPPVHNPIPWRPAGAAAAQRAPQDPFYKTASWRQTRARVLRRCNFRCELRFDGCQALASIADHIMERDLGGSDDDANLRGVCASCHNKRHPDRWRNRHG